MVGRRPSSWGRSRHASDDLRRSTCWSPRRSCWSAPGSRWRGPTPRRMGNSGPHGFSEVLYAYTSAANNNGSAFGGLTVTSDFFQLTLAAAMLLGRLVPIVLVLRLAGSLGRAGQGPGDRGHPAHPQAAVRRPARGRDPHPDGPDLLPRPSPSGPIAEALVMSTTMSPAPPRRRTPRSRRPPPGRAARTLAGPAGRAVPGGAAQARAPTPVAPPGDVPGVARARCSPPSLRFVDPGVFTIAMTVWLWLTVVFGNLAEAVAEGRGKAQAASLRAARPTP